MYTAVRNWEQCRQFLKELHDIKGHTSYITHPEDQVC
jgi:hypothetical protein